MPTTNGTPGPKPSEPEPEPELELEYAIRRVPADAVRPLRHAVLWPSIAVGAQLAAFDHAAGAVHLGLFVPGAQLRALGAADADAATYDGDADDGHPAGVLTLVPTPYTRPLPPALAAALDVPAATDDPPATAEPTPTPATQLRKFALHPALRGRGLGRALFDAAVRLLEQQHHGPHLLHLDARTAQTGFYERLGCTVLDDDVFTKVGPNGDGPAIPHVRMGTVVSPGRP